MKAFLTTLRVSLVLAVVLSTGVASALTFRPITDADTKATVARLIAEASSGGVGDKEELKSTLELAVRVRPIVEMSDAQCPMPIKVMNGTSVAVYNVKVTATERQGKTGTPHRTIFHIPYIPAKSSVSGQVMCTLKRQIYGIGERDVYLSVSPIGEVSRLDDDGIREIVRTKQDAILMGTSFTAGGAGSLNADGETETDETEPAQVVTGDPKIDAILNRKRGRDAGTPAATAVKPKDDSKPSMVGAILEEISSDTDFKLFAGALLKSPDGARELGRFVNRYPGRTSLPGLIPLLATAPAAKVGILLEEGMRDDDGRSGPFLIAAANRVCGAGSPEELRAATWLSALAPETKNVAARDTVLAKCGVGKEQTRARLKAAKGDLLGRALDGMQGDLFDIAVGAMVESKSQLAAEQLLSTTESSKKFDAVAKAVAGFVTAVPKRQELVVAVATGKAGALDETKAKWVGERIDELHGQAADQAPLREILRDMAAGKVDNAEVRKVVFAHRKDAGARAFDPFKAALGDKSLVLSPAWVIAKAEAGELDIFDVVSSLRAASDSSTPSTKSSLYSRTTITGGGTGCQSSAVSATQCLRAVGALKIMKDALDPSFIEAAFGFVRDNPRDEGAIELIKKLVTFGVDPNPAVETLCTAAPTDPGRSGYGFGSGDPLTSAIALSAGNACISRVQSARGSAERWILAGIGVRLTLVFVPFGFVALLARKRFVPVRAQLAKENAELDAVRGKAALTSRLEGKSADDSIASGITDAAQWLTVQTTAGSEETAAAGRALTALTPEMRAALVGTTRALAARAGETGSVATCLCELEGIVLYLACFPGREDQPQTVRRQPAFSDGWPAHMAGILEACAADGKPKRVLSLVFMLRTDGARMTMLVAYDSDTLHLVPEALTTDAPGEADEAHTHEHRYEISSNPG